MRTKLGATCIFAIDDHKVTCLPWRARVWWDGVALFKGMWQIWCVVAGYTQTLPVIDR